MDDGTIVGVRGLLPRSAASESMEPSDRQYPYPSLGSHVFSGKLTWQASSATKLVLTGLGDPGVHRYITDPAGWFGVPLR